MVFTGAVPARMVVQPLAHVQAVGGRDQPALHALASHGRSKRRRKNHNKDEKSNQSFAHNIFVNGLSTGYAWAQHTAVMVRIHRQQTMTRSKVKEEFAALPLHCILVPACARDRRRRAQWLGCWACPSCGSPCIPSCPWRSPTASAPSSGSVGGRGSY